jgi:hypothetical protein
LQDQPAQQTAAAAAAQPSLMPCPLSQTAVPQAAVAAVTIQMQDRTHMLQQVAARMNSKVTLQQTWQQPNPFHHRQQQSSMRHGMLPHLQQHARPAAHALLSTSMMRQPCTKASGAWWMLQQHMCCT